MRILNNAELSEAPEQARHELQDRQCIKKIRYLTELEGKRGAKAMHKKRHAPFTAYECRWCKGWHVGTDRSRRQAAARAKRQE